MKSFGMIILGLVLCSSSLLPSASAAESGDGYFTITSMEVKEVTEGGSTEIAANNFEFFYQPALGISNVKINEIVNYAKAFWKVIENNKPVINVKLDHGNALPEGSIGWTRLGYWSAPSSRAYQVTYKNLYGMSVIDFTFKVIFTHGGKLNGKGKYLANVSIVPANLNVAWGFTFNANAQVSAITNAGAPEDPLAGMQMDLQWSVDSPLRHMEQTESFYVRGDGHFQKL